MKSTIGYLRLISFCLVFAPSFVFSQSITDNRPIRINAGGPTIQYENITFESGDVYSYTNNGHTFAPDLSDHDITNTNWDELYRSETFHNNLEYNIPVRDNACYLLRLHFAEIYFDAPGGRPEPEWGRIFDIIVEGEMKIDDYNILKIEGSALRAAVYTYEVCLEEGDDEINLFFPSRSDNAKVSAIEILPTCGTDCQEQLTFPVELVSFEGKTENQQVVLNWMTAWEENNASFELQRSTDIKNFKTISQVSGKGYSDEVSSYKLIDKNPLNGINYYRLKQIDFNGSFSYSSIIEVEVALKTPNIPGISQSYTKIRHRKTIIKGI